MKKKKKKKKKKKRTASLKQNLLVLIKKKSVYHITKEQILSINSIKTATWKLVPGPFVSAKN